MDERLTPIDELQAFLVEIEKLAPTRQETEGTRVSYRTIEGNEVVDDSLPLNETEVDLSDKWEAPVGDELPIVCDWSCLKSGHWS